MSIRLSSKQGFTLVDGMIGGLLLLIVVVFVVREFDMSNDVSAAARDLSLAINLAENKIEEMRNHPFSSLVADYASGGVPGDTFALEGLNGTGAILTEPLSADLLKIKIVACWKTKNGRVIGEDENLNGTLDGGEDKNGNGELDSVASLATFIFKK